MSCIKPNPPGCVSNPNCPSPDGCPPNVCPDFEIKRNDTRPPFKVAITETDGDPIDLTGLVVEANMWVDAKLKANITALSTSLQFADNIGFNRILVNDIILVNAARSAEQMLVTGFDEVNKIVFVERGINNTTPQDWAKGTCLQIFRIMNAPALSELVFDDELQVDGTFNCNVLVDSFLVYEWTANDTCVAGCFWFEFKVLKMTTAPVTVPSVAPECFLGLGVEWVRRFPTCGAYLIKICNSPTSEFFVPPSTL